jgi:hypothetical protein
MNQKYEAGQLFETNTSGTLELIERVDGKKFKVKFLETGHEAVAYIDNIVAGKVLDPIYKKKKLGEWKPYHAEYESNAGHKLVAFAKRGGKVKVRFVNTGYETEAYIENIKKGKIRDPYERSFLNIGYLGEFDKVSYWKPAKQLWSNMMKRCYNPKDYMGYYGEAFVAENWHCFASFLIDLPALENFEKWLEGKNGGPLYNLDKDLKTSGNKTYSKEMCSFVTEYENKSAGAVNARALDKINGRYK